ncbi:SDR family NAD(P)-dependent oxidoreductase [Herpetosiphon llansteffanensis]
MAVQIRPAASLAKCGLLNNERSTCIQFSAEQIELCLTILQQIADDPSQIDQHDRFKSLVAKIYKQGRKAQNDRKRQQIVNHDQHLREQTILLQHKRGQNAPPLLPSEATSELQRANHCYSCKQSYTSLHFFYHTLCPACAELNYQKRQQRADLTGRVAVVTGGRIKIGYQLVLRLLRDGARVIATTRFAHDCAQRLKAEPDSHEWLDRVQIYGLDLRMLPAVEQFIAHLHATEPSIDLLINNAAQTIKRPYEFYRPLIEAERQALNEDQHILVHHEQQHLDLLKQSQSYALLGTGQHVIDHTRHDYDGLPLDYREHNSWSLLLDQIDTRELLEVQLINAVAPFMLNSQLKPLLLRSPFARRFIINVSAMEGQFQRASKTARHPHTNMAKAALNMLTRTAAQDYAQTGIFMNSVDTGWITDENPYAKQQMLQNEHGFYPPLDAIDGMARIYDPIAQGINHADEPLFGHFLKDYAPFPW